GVEKRNIYSNRNSLFITVSSKGIANALSRIPNDGADFGPDTPNTQTDGLEEAINYAIAEAYKNNSYNGNGLSLKTILILGGQIHIKQGFTISSAWTGKTIGKLLITGQNTMSPYIYLDMPAGTSSSINYAITLDPSSFVYTNIEFDNMQPASPTGNYNYTGFLNADFSSTNTNTNTFISYNLNMANGGFIGLNLNGLQQGYFYDLENYGALNYINGGKLAFYGGSVYSGAIYVSGGNIFDFGCGTTPDGNISYYGQWGTSALNVGEYNADQTFTIYTLFYGHGTGLGSFNRSLVIEPSSGTITINNLIVRDITADGLTGNTSFLFSQGATLNLGNIDIEGVYSTNSYVWTNIPYSSSTNGTTAGTVAMQSKAFRPDYKKYIITLNGYENDTTTNQTVNFPKAFSSYAVITGNSTGLTISASTTGITITSPDSTATYSGIVIVEGY
ncbi:MAG: hypothetical protein ACP5T9_06450, partial [Thermoplasmata archaeon]